MRNKIFMGALAILASLLVIGAPAAQSLCAIAGSGGTGVPLFTSCQPQAVATAAGISSNNLFAAGLFSNLGVELLELLAGVIVLIIAGAFIFKFLGVIK